MDWDYQKLIPCKQITEKMQRINTESLAFLLEYHLAEDKFIPNRNAGFNEPAFLFSKLCGKITRLFDGQNVE